MTAAETTWERHEAGLPARDREERARYVELDAPRRYVTEVSWPRPGNSGIQRLHSRMKDPDPGTQQAQAEAGAAEMEAEAGLCRCCDARRGPQTPVTTTTVQSS